MTNLFKPTSYRSGTMMGVGATAAWKLLSFANSLMLAAYFGACNETDLYFFLIIIMGVGVFFLYRLNTAVLIPQAMALDAQSPLGGRNLLNGFLYLYIGLAGLSALVGILIPVPLMQVFSRFDPSFLILQRSIITWGYVLFGLQVLTSYLISVLEMYKRFTAALLTPLNAALPLLFLIIGGKQYGIISMMYGFVIANLLQIIILGRVMKKELGWKLTRGEIFHSRKFCKNLISNQLIEAATLINGMLPVYLLSGFSTGIVSALNYAKQLSDSASEVFIARITNIAKIELTEHTTHEQTATFNRAFLRAHYGLAFLLTPLVVFSIFFAPDIVTIFFKRGAFTQLDVRQTVCFLRPLLITLLLTVPVLMQNNVVAAKRKLKEFMPYALASTGLCIVLTPFTLFYFGPFSLPYLLAGCTLVGLAINAVFFKRILPFDTFKPALLEMIHLLVLNMMAILPAVFYRWFLSGNNAWQALAIEGILFVGMLAGISYYSGDLKRFLDTAHQSA